jgi:hypothetical protein
MRKGKEVRRMGESYYFEGSETFYADVESENYEDIIVNAAWVSQR